MLDIEVQAPLQEALTEKSEVQAVIKEAIALQAVVKSASARLESIKKGLKDYAEAKGIKRYPSKETALSEYARGKKPKHDVVGGVAILQGSDGTVALISDVSESLGPIPAKDAWKYLKEKDQKGLFWELASINTSAFVKVFGRDEAVDLVGAEPGMKEYCRIEFKALGGDKP